ncbi:hypothetical protein [Marivita sp.]|uniref:hypothetical protein n=1 Tax=Marivita sp. TaxID=2003365 RepID=UPI0025BCEB1A|nr:hypothetical protein [Marivita sp.]
MNADTFFVIGLALGVLSIPAVVSAISNGDRPRIATITLMIAGGMIVYAITNKPGGYPIESIPRVVSSVIQGVT